jgi:hypothetical protein
MTPEVTFFHAGNATSAKIKAKARTIKRHIFVNLTVLIELARYCKTPPTWACNKKVTSL